ncbi:hypothetical protein IscW_ISCW010297, partial [Ixodes scapularis]
TNPCDDFYQHICGSWKGSVNTVTDTLEKAADEVLALPPQGSGLNQSSLQKLAGFYKSCLAESNANTSLTNAVEFTMNYYNLTYQYLVETATIRWTSASRCRFMSDAITIGVTSSLTAKWHDDHQVAFDLINSSVSATASSKDVEDAMAIDAIVIRGPQKKPAKARLFIEDLVNHASFGASLQDWVNTIGRYHTNLTQVTKETPVITNGIDRLSRMSDALQRATTSVRTVFLYLHVLVRVGQLHVLRRIRHGRRLLQEFCRGRIYATILNKPLQVQMVKALKYESSQNYVLDLIDRVAQEMYLKIRNSWLLPGVVSEIQRVLQEQPRYFFWQQVHVMEEVEKIFSRLPEMTSNFLGNLYNVQSASYKVPMWAQCAIHRNERSNLELGSVYDLEEVIHHVLSLSAALK